MDHVEDIADLIRTSQFSSEFNGVLIEGPPGWGKSTATDSAIKKLRVSFAKLSTYSTPGNLFNFFHDNAESGRVCVIDDCAGILNDATAASILKLATWSHSGSRLLTWGSTRRSGIREDFEFYGKIVILVNALPMTPDLEAVRSRCLYHLLRLSPEEASVAILNAAEDRKRFPKSVLAKEVAEHINSHRSRENSDALNFRLLAKGYELARHSPRWKQLLKASITSPAQNPSGSDPKTLLRELAAREPKVSRQFAIFSAKTGLQRRQFFNLRKELGLSRGA